MLMCCTYELNVGNISDKEIMMIQNDLNNRPRCNPARRRTKTLGYKTPAEVFYKEISRKMVA